MPILNPASSEENKKQKTQVRIFYPLSVQQEKLSIRLFEEQN